MTPNEYLAAILARREELAARCPPASESLRKKATRLMEIKTGLLIYEALEPGTARTEWIALLYQDFAALMEEVEEWYDILPSGLSGILHASAIKSNFQDFIPAVEIIENLFLRAEDLAGTSREGGPAASPEHPAGQDSDEPSGDGKRGQK
jgi:hypothetical protein